MDNIWSTSLGRAGSTKRAVNHIRIEDDNDIDEIFDFGNILGQGSFGKVIEAVNKSTKERFAVKTINKEKVSIS